MLRSCAGESGCGSFSWNHAKIVAVDRRAALVGGHNMWTRDYLLDHPVHDLSMQIRGPAAASTARFIDALWQFACDSTGRSNAVSVLSLPAGQARPTSGCLPMPAPPPSASAGNVPVLAVGRLASGITTDFANQSDLARAAGSRAAQHPHRAAGPGVHPGAGRSALSREHAGTARRFHRRLACGRRRDPAYVLDAAVAVVAPIGRFRRERAALRARHHGPVDPSRQGDRI
ncbi:phospholipase D-like domain-containing protein [Vineibacter terrae]|uniref:hypothetical protein n=1 Tax=Vineibacter terrae TaxID=2586908 RepID=UPI0011C91EB9|nr:hypothetical protein [Vineibacter terrae]